MTYAVVVLCIISTVCVPSYNVCPFHMDIAMSGRRRKKRSTDLIDVIQNFTAAQVAGKACPTGDFLLGPESTEATCQMSKSMVQSANALSCKQVAYTRIILSGFRSLG